MKRSNIYSKLHSFLEEIEYQKQLAKDLKELKEDHNLTEEELEVYVSLYLGEYTLDGEDNDL